MTRREWFKFCAFGHPDFHLVHSVIEGEVSRKCVENLVHAVSNFRLYYRKRFWLRHTCPSPIVVGVQCVEINPAYSSGRHVRHTETFTLQFIANVNLRRVGLKTSQHPCAVVA